MSEQSQGEMVQVPFEAVLDGVHEQYQQQIRDIVTRSANLHAVNEVLRSRVQEMGQIINSLNEEVASLRSTDDSVPAADRSA
jgi:hypothetical protein